LFCYCCCCQDKIFSGLPKPGSVKGCCSANPYAHASALKYTISGGSAPKCRICHREERLQNCCAPASDKEMLSPCNCTGEKQFVHRGCLNMERSLRKDAFAQCPECKFHYHWAQVPSQVSGCRRHSVACKAWCLVFRDVLILFSGVAVCMTLLGLLVYGIDGGGANIVDAKTNPAPYFTRPRGVCYLKNPIADRYIPTAETCPSTGHYGIGWFISYFPCTTWFQVPCHPTSFYIAAGACMFFVFMGLYGGCCFKNCTRVRSSPDYGHGMYSHYTYWYFPYYYYTPGYYGYYHSPYYHSHGAVYGSGCGDCGGGGGGDCACGMMGSCGGDGGGEAGAIIAIILLVVLIIMVIVGIVMGTIILIIFIRTFGKYHATALRKQEQARIWVVGDARSAPQQMHQQERSKGGDAVASADAVPIAEAVEVAVDVPTAHYVQPNAQDQVVLATIVAW